MFGAEVKDTVHRIEPESVNVELPDPVKCILNKKVPHLVAVRTVEVNRVAPWRPVPVSEVGSVPAEVVALRAEMVINYVEDHRQTFFMGRIDQLFQAGGTAVSILGSEGINPVVSPVPVARKLCDRH